MPSRKICAQNVKCDLRHILNSGHTVIAITTYAADAWRENSVLAKGGCRRSNFLPRKLSGPRTATNKANLESSAEASALTEGASFTQYSGRSENSQVVIQIGEGPRTVPHQAHQIRGTPRGIRDCCSERSNSCLPSWNAANRMCQPKRVSALQANQAWRQDTFGASRHTPGRQPA